MGPGQKKLVAQIKENCYFGVIIFSEPTTRI